MLSENKLFEIIKNYIIFTNDINKEISNPFIEFRDTFETKNGEIKYFDDMMVDDGRIYAIVGPSGSGKSTFIANLYHSGAMGSPEEQFVPYLNRKIFNERFPNEKDRVYLKYEKAKKEHLAKNHKSFLLESANFDESYVEFLVKMHEEYGSKINLIYITTQSMYENIKRVENRKTSEGGFGLKTRELNHDHVSEQLKMDAAAVRKLAAISENLYILDNSMRKPQLLGKKNGKNGEFQEAKCALMQRKLAKSIFPSSKFLILISKTAAIIRNVYYPTNSKNRLPLNLKSRRLENSALEEVAATIMPETRDTIQNPILIEEAISCIKSRKTTKNAKVAIKQERTKSFNSLKWYRVGYLEKEQLKLTRDFIAELNKEKK